MFISYRRDPAGFVAWALYQHLTEAGIDVFYDIESVRTGRFDTMILNQIEARPYFLIVVTPGSLDRCVEPSDLMRREIEHALRTGRLVIPINTPDFDFRDFDRFLPEIGEEIASWQAVEVPHRYFGYAVMQLVQRYLTPVENISLARISGSESIELERVRAEAAAVPIVTSTQLSAQEHLERALTFVRHGALDDAMADYDRAIALDPTYGPAFNQRGLLRRMLGDADGAVADFDRSIELFPHDARPFNNRGLVQSDRGRVEEAIADFDRAIELFPRDPRPFNNRGLARQRQGDFDGAITDFGWAINLDPTSASAHNNRGCARREVGDVDGAIADFGRAIDLDPGRADAYFNRGVALRDRSDVAGAIADLERGRALAPEDAGFDRQLRRLRDRP